jgi:hypothetical protein
VSLCVALCCAFVANRVKASHFLTSLPRRASATPVILRASISQSTFRLAEIFHMSSSDWRRWCDESQRRGLQSNLASLDGVSFVAITVYAVAAAVAASVWLRCIRLKDSQRELLWPGFKWFVPPRAALNTSLQINRRKSQTFDHVIVFASPSP